MNIETLCDWVGPKRIRTKYGDRDLYTCTPAPESFWEVWRADKDACKAAGLRCGPAWGNDDVWEAKWWRPVSKEEIKAKVKVAKKSRAEASALKVPCPAGLEYLPYQQAGVSYAVNAFNSGRDGVLIADEMGLGKTIQAIGICNIMKSIDKILIICPASLKLNWEREFGKWATKEWNIGIADSKQWPETDIVIVNYDILHKHEQQIRGETWDMLIADESHYLKGYKSRRTMQVIGGKGIQPIPTKRKLFLTGTPIPNRHSELWTTVKYLDPNGLGENWRRFHDDFCDRRETHFNGATQHDVTRSVNGEVLQREMRENFMVRRLKKNVLKELPAKRHQIIELGSNGAVRLLAAEKKLSGKLEKEKLRLNKAVNDAIIANDDEAHLLAMNELEEAEQVAFQEMARVRHDLAVAKAPEVVKHLESYVSEGTPVVCFAHHKDVVKIIEEGFPGKYVTVTGETPMKARQDAVDKFQDGKAALFIGNIKAAGVGITLTKSSNVVFAEIDWTPAVMNQASDRCHRIGQENAVLVQYIVYDGSLDARMANKLVSKQRIIDAALDREQPPERAEKKTESVNSVILELKKPMEFSEEQREAISAGLRILAAKCDGAREIDGAGFNKFDSNTGKSLAAIESHSKRQLELGFKLVTKYKRQLDDGLISLLETKT